MSSEDYGGLGFTTSEVGNVLAVSGKVVVLGQLAFDWLWVFI